MQSTTEMHYGFAMPTSYYYPTNQPPSHKKSEVMGAPTASLTSDKFVESSTLLHPLAEHLKNTHPHLPKPNMIDPRSSVTLPSLKIKSDKPKLPKKPKRPLTAYHIYFQIEREFIIQTRAGEDADKSILDGKTFFFDVPDRYKNIKLSPDWYFGPGKRAKRKHRKQHGKISFLELSRVISARWSKLDETDPDIKHFVSKIAKQENEEYKRELKVYRENLTNTLITPPVISNNSCSMNMSRHPTPQMNQHFVAMPPYQTLEHQHTSQRPSSLPSHGAHPTCDSHSFNPNRIQFKEEIDQLKKDGNGEEFSYQQRTFAWGKPQLKDDFDNCTSFIDDITEVPPPEERPCIKDSPSFLDSFTCFDQKIDDACTYDDETRVDTLKFLDISDEEILGMWKSTDSE